MFSRSFTATMPPQPFKALKVPSNSTLLAPSSSTDSNGAGDPTKLTATKPEDISSPHELTAFVGVSLAVDARFLRG
jgi:hypothetical protein